MKNRKIFNYLGLLFSSALLFGCNKTPSTVEPEPEEHVHNYINKIANEKFLATSADCDHAATYYYSCDCGQAWSETFTYGEPLGHSFTSYVGNNDATCTHNGTETAHCDHAGCDKTDTKEIADSKKPHNFVKEESPYFLKSAATCFADAVYFEHCDECGYIDENRTFEVQLSELEHDYDPITGHCQRGCGTTLGSSIAVNYANGSYKYVVNDSSSVSITQGRKEIFDISFTGELETTSFFFIPRKDGHNVPKSNIAINAFDENGDSIEYRYLSASNIYTFDQSFSAGSHIYIHAKAIGGSHSKFYLSYATHQYTNIQYVAAKKATCANPAIKAHHTFDEAETVGKWISGSVQELKDISTFYEGEAGTGHDYIHFDASEATPTSPALKEHWLCKNCGGYYLDETSDVEVEYKDLYDNRVYGAVQTYYAVAGRGVAVKVLVTLGDLESIETNGGAACHLVLADGTIVNTTIGSISINNHMAEILCKGLIASDYTSNEPKAFYM